MAELIFLIICIAGAYWLAMNRAPLWWWAAGLGAVTLLLQTSLYRGIWEAPGLSLLWLPAIVLALLSVPAIRKAVLIAPVFGTVKRMLPRVSDTEAQALEAGTVGFDAQLFSGTPDWEVLRAVPPVSLTAEEQAFLDGPTEELCGMLDDWRIRHTEREIPEEVWEFVKRHGFLGMLISKTHGGLGFSAQAQS
ncbi:MAG: acyl-CoA dehydrogenase, partial [Hyphomicrobiaceae bacterium]